MIVRFLFSSQPRQMIPDGPWHERKEKNRDAIFYICRCVTLQKRTLLMRPVSVAL